MDETRDRAYLQLIQTLLTCPKVAEPQILQDNLELLDSGFLQACESTAATLTQQGQENAASFLRNLASQVGQFLDGKNEGDSYDSESENPQEYVKFILELLQAEQDSNSDIKVIYPMLAERQHLLNPRFAETLQQVALRHDKRGDRECRASLPNNIVGRRHCRLLVLVANNSDAAGFDIISLACWHSCKCLHDRRADQASARNYCHQ